MDAEEAENLSGGDEKVTLSSNPSFEANIEAAVIDILPPAGDVDHLGKDCSVNDTAAAAVEPSNISTASTQHVAFSEDAATEVREGRLSSEDVRMLAGRQINNSHAEQDEKEAVSVEPPVVLDAGHAVEKYAADNSLTESTAHGEVGIEPPTSPPTVARHEEGTEQRDKHGNEAPSSTEEGPSDDLRKALVGFYGVHNPPRIATLDVILTQYAGKEDLLIERLEQKYSADLSYARRAVAGKYVRPPPGENTPPRPRGAIEATTAAARQQPPSGKASIGPQLSRSLSTRPRQPAPHAPRTDNGTLHVGGSPLGPQSAAAARPQLSGSAGSTANLSAASSSSYMAYLADQIILNVEGLLPGPSSGGGSGAPVPSLGSSASMGVGGAGAAGVGTAAALSSSSATRRLYGDPRSNPFAPSPIPAGSSNGRGGGGGGSGSGGAAGGGGGDAGGSRVPATVPRHATLAPPGALGANHSSSAADRVGEQQGTGVTTVIGEGGVAATAGETRHEGPDPIIAARVKVLEEERVGLLAACRRLQGKAEASGREAAATEELREAGQRKIAGFAERAAAAERQARDVAVRLRALESEKATLQAEKEASARRCDAKHTQLLSAIDLQMSLRSQLEGLLEIVPPPLSTMSSKASQDPTARGGLKGTEEPAAVASTPRKSGGIPGEVVPVVPVPRGGTQVSPADGTAAEGDDGDSETEYRDAVEGYSGSAGSGVHGEEWDAGGGDEGGGGGGLGEVKRRCSLLEVSLRASRTEALTARRARDAAESTVREQRETLTVLRERSSELEARLAKEKEAGKGAARAGQGLETELGLRLAQLRTAEVTVTEQAEANARLREELRGASARLHTASAAREALLSFCRQARTAVELEAAEHVSRVEESAAMRREEGLSRGLKLASMAEEAGNKRVAAANIEIDRLGKALFASRAELAGSEARGQAFRRELGRAAETIAGLSRSTTAALGAGSGGATAPKRKQGEAASDAGRPSGVDSEGALLAPKAGSASVGDQIADIASERGGRLKGIAGGGGVMTGVEEAAAAAGALRGLGVSGAAVGAGTGAVSGVGLPLEEGEQGGGYDVEL